MTWLELPADHPFGLANLPYGVFSTAADPQRRIGVRIGDQVLDAGRAAVSAGYDAGTVWTAPDLNPYLAQGRPAWDAGRAWLTEVLTDAAYASVIERHLLPVAEVTMHLPITVHDYVDYYASEHHAMNVGKIFRPDSPALPVNWKHLPIGYHGRSGTVVVTGTDFHRPCGQRKGPQDPAPVYGPSIRLDIEAELGFVVGTGTELGGRVGVDEAADYLFGVVILNDWSARDLQAWEYVPLGPYLGKSFCTSISAWVTPMAALADAKVSLPRGEGDPQVLDYLASDSGAGDFGLDVHVEVAVNGTIVSRPEYRDMYWSPAQMLAHMTVNGASVKPGGLFGSGTISGAQKGQRGSFLELSWGGQETFELADGTTRTFLLDGDEVTMTAWAPGPDGARIGLGEVSGRILPAR